MPECFIRGNNIKYLRIPEEVIEKVKEDRGKKRRYGAGDYSSSNRGGRSGMYLEKLFLYINNMLYIYIDRGGRGRGRGSNRN